MPSFSLEKWAPSCSRQTNDASDQHELIGDNRYQSFLPPDPACIGDLGAELTACCLGFGDIRHLLASATELSEIKGNLNFKVDMVDWKVENCARGVLLTYLASTLDVTDSNNIHFFWGISYCLEIPRPWLDRLRNYISKLIEQLDSNWSNHFCRKQEDYETVKRVLKIWQTENLPSVSDIETARLKHLTKSYNCETQNDKDYTVPNENLEKIWERACYKTVDTLEEMTVVDGNVCPISAEPGLRATLIGEVRTYVQHGSIYMPVVYKQFLHEDAWCVNPTLLTYVEPRSSSSKGKQAKQQQPWKWQLHHTTNVFDCFLPLNERAVSQVIADTTAYVASPDKSPLSCFPRALTKACIVECRRLILGFQTAKKQRTMLVRFACGEALSLIYDGTLKEEAYYAVDTSSLADKVGYVNLLIACPRLLKPFPLARLYTASKAWPTTKALSHANYLKKALGGDPKLFPSLYGVRLMGVPDWGREYPQHRDALKGGAQDYDRVAWMPLSTCTVDALRPSLLAEEEEHKDHGLHAALKRVAQIILPDSKRALNDGNHCGMHVPSSLALLWLLRGIIERVDGVLPDLTEEETKNKSVSGKGPLWEYLTEHLASILGIGERWKRQWVALCGWAFGGSEGRPELVTLRPTAIRPVMEAIGRGASILYMASFFSFPDLDPIAMEEAIASGAMQFPVRKKKDGTPMEDEYFDLDTVYFDPTTSSLTCLLPKDALISRPPEPRQYLFRLVVISNGKELGDEEWEGVSQVKEAPFKVSPPKALSDLYNMWLNGSYKANYNTNVISLKGMSIGQIASYENCHKFVLKIDKEGSQPLKGAAISLQFDHEPATTCVQYANTVTFTLKSWNCSAQLFFLWPFSTENYSMKVLKSKRQIEVTLFLSEVWAIDEGVQPQLQVKGLPEWDRSREKLLTLHMLAMYSSIETEAIHSGKTELISDTMFQVRHILHQLFTLVVDVGPVACVLKDEAEHLPEPSQEPTIHFYMRKLLFTKDGRPLLLFTFIDEKYSKRMYVSEKEKILAVNRLVDFATHYHSELKHTTPELQAVFTKVCSAPAMRIIREMVLVNAIRLAVPLDMKTKLPDKAYGVSFVMPAYSDFLVDPGDKELLESARAMAMDKNKATGTNGVGSTSQGSTAKKKASEGKSSSSAAAAAGGGGGRKKQPASEPAGTAASRHTLSEAIKQLRTSKERGNHFFSIDGYLSAITMYESAVSHNYIQLFPSSTEIRQLTTDLYNNIAQAALKLADQDEAQGYSASVTLHLYRAAEIVLNDVLTYLDPGNEKALYRRALTLYHLALDLEDGNKKTRLAKALADIEALKGSNSYDTPNVKQLLASIKIAHNMVRLDV